MRDCVYKNQGRGIHENAYAKEEVPVKRTIQDLKRAEMLAVRKALDEMDRLGV